MPNASTLEEAIRDSGEGWIIDSFSPPENAVSYLEETLDQVRRIAVERFGTDTAAFIPSDIVGAYNSHPLQMRAFFQALGGSRTPEILLMVWRVLQGMQIKSIHFEYQLKERFHFEATLESPYGEDDPPYVSDNVFDFSLLRHIGSLESGGPILDGFYALRMKSY